MVKRVGESYKKHLFAIIFGSLLKIIEAFFDLLIPLFMKAIIDLNEYGESANIPNSISRFFANVILWFGFENKATTNAIVGGVIILVMGIVGFSLTMIAQYIAARTSTDISREIRNSLYDKLLKLSRKERDKIGNSKILTTINSDSYQIQQGVLYFIRLVVRCPFILVGSLVFSFILDYRVGFSFLITVPLIVLINVLVLKKSSTSYVKIQQNLDELSSSSSEAVDGDRVIRSANSQDYENNKFKVQSTSYFDKTTKVNKFNALINPLTFAITSIVLIVIVFILRDELFSSTAEERVIMTSTIIAEMSYLAQIFFVTIQLTTATIDIVKAGVSRKRIDSILKINPSISGSSSANIFNDDSPLLEFKNVSFSFNNDDNYFLENINFTLFRGETIGIIGGTGSGKTTLMNLIERFYDASVGEILYKGINIKDIELSILREDIGLVAQKSSLFKGTIKSNYLMANEMANDEDIIEALKMSEAYEFVQKYEDGIEHVVNENGNNFSGGQKQRLCVGRALLKKSNILIFDDATSALDLLTDKKIRERLNKIHDCSKIIVSQRVATIQNADKILVLDNGHLVAQGKRDELVKQSNIYREIFETQIKRDE